MSIEKVRAYFREMDAAGASPDETSPAGTSPEGQKQAGQSLEGRIQEFPVSSATVELAAAALGVEPARIAKSLSFMADGPLLVVAAGDCKIDNPRYKAQFHTKAKMLSRDETRTFIDHDVGGVCPFALPPGVPVYLDVSLRRFSTVFPAAGSGNSAMELTCEELERYASNFSGWVDVCKGWREEDSC